MKGLIIMRKKNVRKYKSNIIKEAITPIIFVVICGIIPYIIKDVFCQTMVIIGLIPLMIALMIMRLTSIENSNSFIDIRLCEYKYLFSKNVDNVWAMSEIDNSELIDWTFVEIRNIGETMVTKINIIINHDSDKKNLNNVIQYAIKKDDCIYFAISKKKDLSNNIKNITIIDLAGKDSGRNFHGKLYVAGDTQIFSMNEVAIENKKPIEKSCYRIGLPHKQLQS